MKTEAYINKIIKETGLSKKEIQDRVEEKKIELKGLITEEGALFIIAKELGVDVKSENKELLKDFEINVSDVTPNMKNLKLIGRIKELYQVREFNKKDGDGIGQVGSFILHDSTGNIRITLWDDQTKIFENSNFEKNELVKIINGYAKTGKNGDVQVHLGKLGKIIINPEDIDYKKYPKMEDKFLQIDEIVKLESKDIAAQGGISVEGKIMQKYPIREFTRKNGDPGKVGSIMIMDSTGTIRITFWNEETERLESFDVGNTISITSLNPRISTYDNKTIELHANKSSILKKLDSAIEINTDLVEKIEQLQNKTGIISFQGVISSIDNIRTVSLKSGDEVSLLGFVVSDDTAGIRATVWREKANELSETLSIGTGVSLKNVLIKFSNFSNSNEISMIKDSEIEIIPLEIKNIKKNIENIVESIEKIEQLQNKTGIVSFQGVISSIDNIRTVSLKSGDEVSLLGFVVSDDTFGIRATVWREKADELSETLSIGTGVSLKNVLIKFSNFSNSNEISMIKDSEIEIIPLEIKNIKKMENIKRETKPNFTGNYTKINTINSPGVFEIKGFIAKELNNITIYEACTNCFKKLDNCSCEEKGDSEYRMIFNLIIDDESGTIRTTFIGDKAEKLIGEETDLLLKLKEGPDFESFLENKSAELLGKDITIRGRAKFSEYSNSYEVSVYDFQDVKINEELERIIKEIET